MTTTPERAIIKHGMRQSLEMSKDDLDNYPDIDDAIAAVVGEFSLPNDDDRVYYLQEVGKNTGAVVTQIPDIKLGKVYRLKYKLTGAGSVPPTPEGMGEEGTRKRPGDDAPRSDRKKDKYSRLKDQDSVHHFDPNEDEQFYTGHIKVYHPNASQSTSTINKMANITKSNKYILGLTPQQVPQSIRTTFTKYTSNLTQCTKTDVHPIARWMQQACQGKFKQNWTRANIQDTNGPHELLMTAIVARALDHFVFGDDPMAGCFLHQVPTTTSQYSSTPAVADLAGFLLQSHDLPGIPLSIGEGKQKQATNPKYQAMKYSTDIARYHAEPATINQPILVLWVNKDELNLGVCFFAEQRYLLEYPTAKVDSLTHVQAWLQAVKDVMAAMQDCKLDPRKPQWVPKATHVFPPTNGRRLLGMATTLVREMHGEHNLIKLLLHPRAKQLANMSELKIEAVNDHQIKYKYLEAAGPLISLQMVVDVCTQLQLLHNNRLVHGDVRGANIVWRTTGSTLIDFEFVGTVDDAYPYFYRVVELQGQKMQFRHDWEDMARLCEFDAQDATSPAYKALAAILRACIQGEQFVWDDTAIDTRECFLKTVQGGDAPGVGRQLLFDSGSEGGNNE
eukprot:TRINITY_DN66486_c4_g2_i2.p1 TRINITY_DN66486_c4_g2~~TRINITY_DN66486_c4_g2_i2.p1  ORF type:complete len:617 (-),score=55.91 TRINITY_DN66486_c4_g2_i2:1027-2877(-)